MPDKDITVFVDDYWHQLRNIWFGAAIGQLSKFLDGVLQKDLEKIPLIYRVGSKTNITELLCSIEKEFALTANYAKGYGSMFKKWMLTYHLRALLHPVARKLDSN